MRVALGSDHAGRNLRMQVVEHLKAAGHDVLDLGTDGADSVDYPEFAAKVAKVVAAGEVARGIVVCGTGVGVSIAANKVAGVRAALCTNEYMARMARTHNDANVLCMGERVVGSGVAVAIAEAFVAGEFEGGRHARRVAQIDALGAKEA